MSNHRAASITLAVVLAVGGVAVAGARLEPAIADLSRAFRHSSAADLRPFLSAEHKVYLALPAVHAKSRFLGADQVFYLFQAFFRDHPTRSFAVRSRRAEAGGHEVFLDVRWSYQSAEGPMSEPLLLLLVEEEGRWLIREIRAIRS